MSQITTLIPTYQRPMLLRRAIESVLAQSYGDFTLSIHDNGSQDETREVVFEYQKKDSRIRYFSSETNRGLVANFATALQSVDTPYYSFLCDDDYLLPHFYETALKGFHRSPDAGFSSGHTLFGNSKGRVSKQHQPPFDTLLLPAAIGIDTLSTPGYFPGLTGTLFRSAPVVQFGSLEIRVSHALDIEWILRHAAAYPCILSSTPVAVLTKWECSASSRPAAVHEINFDTIIANVKKYYVGTETELFTSLEKLHQMKLAAFKHIWIYSLLANQLPQAAEGRVYFLQNGGTISTWKERLLRSAEKNGLCRKLFHLYHRVKTTL